MRRMGTKKKMTAARSKKTLEQIEVQTAKDVEKKRKRKRYPAGGKTKIAEDVRAGKRRKVPMPDGKSADEIMEMDPDDPSFKHKTGRKRKYEGVDEKELDWRDSVRQGKQERAQKRRAKVRRHEAAVVASVKKAKKAKKTRRGKPKVDKALKGTPGTDIDLYDEDIMVDEGILSMDDWDNEELARGYRRNRSGRFGPAPAMIPREVQQEAFRRLLRRGQRELASAYLTSVEELARLAREADSEKVRLEAIKELQNRFAGKVPDHLLVSPDAPYQDMLADSIVPLSEMPPIDMELQADGTYGLGDGVDAPTGLQHAAAEGVPDPEDAPPSPDNGKQVPRTKKRNSQPSRKKGAK